MSGKDFGRHAGMPASRTRTLPPRYRDVRLVARGGMGEVVRAVDDELGRDVAIKVLAERFADDPALRARFQREALAAARVSTHPNIVTIFDVAEHDGRPMLVMEYVPGGSLEERLGERGAPLPTRQVLAWLDDAAAALDAAHAAGVVHRDVKPGNLLLDEQDRVRVADFGIASAAGLGQLTQTGTILGTAGYLSPEQAKGQRAGPASDRYGLAVVAWELLAGRRPFDSGSPTAEATAHVNEPVPPITEANPTLPAALDAVFRRALDKEPARRPASAAELVAELRHAFSADGGATVVLPSRQPRRRPWPAIAAVLALTFAALGALAAVLATHDSESSPPPRTVVHTVTQPGTTVERTVTSTPRQTSGESGATLNNSAFALMQRREFAAALPLLEQAVAKLNGSSDVNEAYADYNLAYTRLALGDCTDVDQLLDRSQAVQGHRHEIDRLRHDAHKRCGPGGKGGEPD